MSGKKKKEDGLLASYQDSEELYQTLFEQSADGIFIADPHGHYVEVNQRGCDMLGYTREEMLKLSMMELIPEEELKSNPIKMDDLRKGKALLTERNLLCKNGQTLPVEINAKMLSDGSLVGLVRDISERIKIQQSLTLREEAYRTLVENSPDFISRYDQNYRRTYVNPSIQNLFHTSPEEILDKVPGEDSPVFAPEIFVDQIKQVLETSENRAIEIPFRTSTGEMHWGHIRFVPEFGSKNEVTSVLAIGRDIHEVKEKERHFHMLADNFPDYVVRFDKEFRFIYVNPAVEKVSGIAAKDFIGVALTDLPHNHTDDQLPLLKKFIKQAFVEGVANETEMEWLTTDGQKTFDIRNIPENDAAGKVVSVLCIAHDISVQKQSEQNRKKHFQFLQNMNKVNDAIRQSESIDKLMKNVLDLTLEILECDRAYLLFPCDPDSATWTVPMERTKPEYPGVLELNKAMPMDESISETFRLLLGTNKPIAFSSTTEHDVPPVVRSSFSVQSFLAMSLFPKYGSPWQFGIHQCAYERDWDDDDFRIFEAIGNRLSDGLTSRLLLEDLKVSQDRLAKAVQSAHLGYWEQDLMTGETVLSGILREILQPPADSTVLAKEEWERTFKQAIHPDDQPVVDELLESVVKGNSADNAEFRMITASGDTRFIHHRLEVICDQAGRSVKLFGTVLDISERKKDEQEQVKLRTNLESLWGLARISGEDRETMFKYILAEIIEKTESEHGFFCLLNHDESRLLDSIFSLDSMVTYQTQEKNFEYPVKKAGIWGGVLKSRKHLVINDYSQDFPGKKGLPEPQVPIERMMVVPVFRGKQIVAIGAVANKKRDYTEEDLQEIDRFLSNAQIVIDQKLSDEKMHVSDQRLRLHRDLSPLGFLEWDENFRASEWNDSCETIFGFTREEAIGKHAKDLILPPQVHHLVDGIYESLMNQTGGHHSINENITKDGRIITVEWFNTTLVDENGHAFAISSICRDVTEQYEMERKLITREREYRTLIENVPDIIARYNCDLQRIYVNRAWEELCGLPSSEVLNSIPDSKDGSPTPTGSKYYSALQQVLKTGIPQQVEFEWVNAKGETIYLDYVIVTELDEKGSVQGLLAVGRDLTERKHVEDQVKRMNRVLQMLSETNQALVKAQDEQSLLDDVCRIIVEIGGYRTVWVGYREYDEEKSVRPVAHAGYNSHYIENAKVSWDDTTDRGKGPGGDAIRTRKPCVVQHVLTDPAFESWRELATKNGFNSLVALPLIADGEAFGAVGIYSSQDDAFEQEEVEILMELANDLAFGIMAARTKESRQQAEYALRQNQEMLRAVIDTMEESLTYNELVYDDAGNITDYRILEANKAFEKDTGLKRDHIVGGLATDLYGMSEDYIHQYWTENLSKDRPDETTYYVPELKSWKHILTSKPVNGRFVISYFDVTELVEAQEALRESEERFRLIAENTADTISIYSMDLKPIYVSPSVVNLRGYTSEEAMKQTIDDILTPASKVLALNTLKKEMRLDDAGQADAERRVLLELEQYKKDGSTIWVELSVIALRDNDGKANKLLTVSRDITERRRAEATIRENEARYRSLFENSPMGIFRSSIDGRFLDANYELASIFGYDSPQDVIDTIDHIGKQLYVLPEERDRIINEQLEVTHRTQHSCLLKKRDGSVFNAELYLVTIRDDEGKPVHLEGILLDVTRRVQSEESIRKLSHAVEQSSVSIIITDTNGIIEYVNPKFEEVSGYKSEEVMGVHTRMLKSGMMSEEFYKHLWETITKGHVWQGEFHNRKKNGELFWESASISPVKDNSGNITHFVAIKEDVTLRKDLEQQFHQAQKMEAVGQLAGGVAHDFNNMLNVIMGYAELGLSRLDEKEPLYADLQDIANAATRSAELTRQLLAFASKQTIIPIELDINEAVERILKMLRRLIGEDIKLNWEPGHHLGTVKIDPAQVDQILANLCVNSRDAISGVGSVTIQTYLEKGEEEKATPHVVLSVTDTGSGISQEVIPKLFEPFFTTKEKGKGTGLGLATIYGIVRQNKGKITVESALGKGTTFKIYLPQYSDQPTDVIEKKEKKKIVGGDETILLVEDEPSTLRMVRQVLEKIGYHVISARTPGEAISKSQRYVKSIDIIITDVIMPEMNGPELVGKIKQIYADVKVLFMSGYSDNLLDLVESGGTVVNYIPKPFSLSTFTEKVREVLSSVE